LQPNQRLISIPIDAAHGLIGQVQAGDHVDVFAGFNVVPLDRNFHPLDGGQSHAILRLVMQDVPVVSVSGSSNGSALGGATSNGGSTVTLKATDAQAEELAFASDNGKIWLILRPAAGAKFAPPSLVTVETMLLGVPPVTMMHVLGGR
jgi:Flp pilus assembly protein CpaB